MIEKKKVFLMKKRQNFFRLRQNKRGHLGRGQLTRIMLIIIMMYLFFVKKKLKTLKRWSGIASVCIYA